MVKSKRRSARKIKKGGSAWQYTQSVYGGPDQQQAVGILPNGGTSNLISMNSQSGGGLPALTPNEFTGGRRRRRKGGNILSELAVPASLLIANEFGKKYTMNNHHNTYFKKANRKTNKRYRNKRNKTFRRRS